jgi:hypothetical protein
MNNAQTNNDSANNLELATAQRLRRLSTMPVDLQPLERQIKSAIPPPATAGLAQGTRLMIGPSRWLAVAASVAMLLTVGAVVVATWPRPVLASPQVLESIYEHNTAMSSGINSGTTMNQPDMGTMACCVQKVEGRAVTCFTLTISGKRVSMAVGDAKHFKVPQEAGQRTVGGIEYRFQSSGKVNMVMAVKDGAWLCLMGEPTVNDLIAHLATMPVRH